MKEKDPRITAAFDALVGRIFSPEVSQAPVPPITRPGCIPLWEIQPDRTWTAAEIRHVSSCRRCQRNLVTMWKLNGPERIREYFQQAREKFLWRPHLAESLGFAAAATSDEVAVPLLVQLGPDGKDDPPLEVSIWEEAGELKIHGVWTGVPEACAGMRLGVELWDDSGSHSWTAPFRVEAQEAVASLSAPMPDKLEGGFGKRVVAIAWMEMEDSN